MDYILTIENVHGFTFLFTPKMHITILISSSREIAPSYGDVLRKYIANFQLSILHKLLFSIKRGVTMNDLLNSDLNSYYNLRQHVFVFHQKFGSSLNWFLFAFANTYIRIYNNNDNNRIDQIPSKSSTYSMFWHNNQSNRSAQQRKVCIASSAWNIKLIAIDIHN